MTRFATATIAGRVNAHARLATLAPARAGALVDNRVVYAQPLLERYRRFFDAARPPGDHPDPFFTFLRLSDLKHGHVRVHGSRVAGSCAAGVATHDLGVRRITRVAFAS